MGNSEVKVCELELSLSGDKWLNSKEIANRVHQLATSWYGKNVGEYLLRGVSSIANVKEVISHGLDRYSPDVVSKYDPPLRGQFDPTKTGWAIPLDRGQYPITLVLWNFALSRERVNTDPAGLLFLRKGKSVVLTRRGYADFYGILPEALDTALLLHLR